MPVAKGLLLTTKRRLNFVTVYELCHSPRRPNKQEIF